ncbi:MAG TPA: FAD:protein FMN transferase, partial [Candidatus Saccharimonadales bacterium]
RGEKREKRCSRFLSTSELSRFNQKAGVRQGISPELRDILTKARDIGVKTDGLYNPFVLPVLQRVGYLHSIVNDYADDPTNDYSDRHMTPVEDLEIGNNWARIPYGTALDLGGCGKGYIGDLLADIVDENEVVEGYWLSIGGDVVARGIHETGQPIAIGIQDEASEKTIARIYPRELQRYAVATSTVMRRKGLKDGVAWHHIIDPRTGRPAESDVQTMTICEDSLFMADVHATNCIIIGAEHVTAYLQKHAIADAVLQAQDSTQQFFGDRVERYVDKAIK